MGRDVIPRVEIRAPHGRWVPVWEGDPWPRRPSLFAIAGAWEHEGFVEAPATRVWGVEYGLSERIWFSTDTAGLRSMQASLREQTGDQSPEVETLRQKLAIWGDEYGFEARAVLEMVP